MSLQTQAVVSGHLSVEDICRRLRENYGARSIVARPGRHSDYWTIEFVDHDSSLHTLHAFLNSWAADDYAELGAGASTLLSTEFTPRSLEIADAVIGGSKGWKRRIEADKWTVAD